jgi:Xaa-Pro aminopeptidase
MENLLLLPDGELDLRISKLRKAAGHTGAFLLADNAVMYYLTGRVFSGWAYIPTAEDQTPLWFVRRPVGLKGEGVIEVRKPEEIPGHLAALGRQLPEEIGLEMNVLSYSTITRFQAVFPDAKPFNASGSLAVARAVKTDYEISLMERSGVLHEAVYRRIPKLFKPGMTDADLDIAIETLSREHGCLGQFRISGQSMEFFMGNVLTGNNADTPSPYDFAMGGGGLHPSLPVGACGEEIKLGSTVMVDVNGDYTGYMTDMTRVFSFGEIPQLARDAHECSVAIHREFRKRALPGVKASEMYELAANMAKEAGFEKYFMGHTQHASFCGHGIGIEINEGPVIAPRSRDILAVNNAIAMEPKFVIPGIGAVGIENTYIITPEGARCITNAPEEILPLY